MSTTPRVAMTLEQCWHRVPGGTAVAALGMARALSARRDVDVIGVAARHRDAPPSEWRPPIRVEHLGLPRAALYESWHRLRRPAVEKATGPVAAIHATSIAVPPKSAPLIVTIHDLAFLHAPQNFTRRGLSFFTRGLDLARAEADLVMCPSQGTARDCEANGFDPARLRVVPLGIDPQPASTSDIERVRARHSLGNPYVLWTGTIEPRKNLSGVIEAWRRATSDHDLVLVGPHGWNEDLEVLIGSGDDRVHVLGFVPRAELDALYAGAEVFLWPSTLEGFGFPVLEAMAQGTPVVTSRGTSTEEIVGDAGIVVDPRDPGDVAEGVQRVLNDDGLAAKLAESGRHRAATFTWDRTGELLVAMYDEVTRIAA